jgi:flavin reductase (DIM6/NTAB) family NADH-FMN oxidoreductase RutF
MKILETHTGRRMRSGRQRSDSPAGGAPAGNRHCARDAGQGALRWERERLFRNATGVFATGVTIITTAVDGEVHGMTANGFMSVSLDPLLVVVSISGRARMRSMLASSRRYGVSVLTRSQQPLSGHFAGRPIEGATVPWTDVEGVPVLDGALTQLRADVVDERPAGDHVLFIGEVTHLGTAAGDPLIFHGGAYRFLERPAEFTATWQGVTNWF